MPTSLYKDLNFLNRYFTSKEFDFINNATIGGQTIDNLIDRETKIRDVIVNLKIVLMPLILALTF